MRTILLISAAIVTVAKVSHADIFQWEYINPADPAQGKQQSTTLAPEGAGVDAVPGADLSYHDLTKAYMIGADIRNASLLIATLTDADFTDADVRGANFSRDLRYPDGTGITPAQLYSTASYQAYDLSDIELVLNDLGGGNFAGQNLLGASFWGADLTGANLRGANLKNANLIAGIIDADFTDAEVRGATFSSPICLPTFACFSIGSPVTPEQLYSTATYQSGDLRDVHGDLSNLITTNLVLPNGHLDGLDLEVGGNLTVRDYDGNPSPIPITVDQHLAMGPGGTLRMVFEADAWDSTIFFAPGIPVALGGTLELTFADDVNIATQLGRTFDLFDWTGVSPTGAFAVSGPYAWDVSNLYTTGEVTLTAVPEPSGLLLLSCVLAATLAIRRRANLLPSFALQVAASIFSVAVIAAAAHADIYQWEYINPADPGQGKQQSTTLAPGGAIVGAWPGAIWDGANLTMAYLIGADLRGASGSYSNLSNADLSQANLTNARFDSATLTGADFTGTEVRGANFNKDDGGFGCPFACSPTGTGIALPQLYSTASYRAHDLSGISLDDNNLAGGNFVGQNLSNAYFLSATLTDAEFTGAKLTGAFFTAGGAGLTTSQLYSTASYQAHNLMGIHLVGDLSGWNFAGQNLTNAGLAGTVTDADFNDAQVRGASLSGITLSQLYATASYQAHDLTGVGLSGSELAGGNFAGQNLANASLSSATLTAADFRESNLTSVNFSQSNLTGVNFAGQILANASFFGATLTDADFSGAKVRGASFGRRPFFNEPPGFGVTLVQLYSTASYHDQDLSGINLHGNNLTGGNFAGQNLTNAYFTGTTLTDVDFTDADVRGTRFDKDIYTCGYGQACFPGLSGTRFGTGISLAQLYSTASYQRQDLNGISLGFNDLTGGNFAGQVLTNASFYGATLTDADLTAADARGVQYLDIPPSANTTNLIRPNGHINGLDLSGGGLLVVRDYDGITGYVEPPLPITVDQHLVIGPGGTLRMVFEADAWDSTISFAPGIPVTLGGTLELAFAADVNLASQHGRTFDLFNWTGVNPTGAFAIASPYVWDLSNLYTTGEVRLTAIPEPTSLVPFLFAVTGWGVRRTDRKFQKLINA